MIYENRSTPNPSYIPIYELQTRLKLFVYFGQLHCNLFLRNNRILNKFSPSILSLILLFFASARLPKKLYFQCLSLSALALNHWPEKYENTQNRTNKTWWSGASVGFGLFGFRENQHSFAWTCKFSWQWVWWMDADWTISSLANTYAPLAYANIYPPNITVNQITTSDSRSRFTAWSACSATSAGVSGSDGASLTRWNLAMWKY